MNVEQPRLTPRLLAQLQDWLAEDLGRGDLTAPALSGRRAQATWIAKQEGVFCGGGLALQLFRLLDPELEAKCLVAEGAAVQSGESLLHLDGQATALVGAERTALNLAMRLSGIATATACLLYTSPSPRDRG